VYTEAVRVQIRRYLGFGGIWRGENQRLESAITATQAEVDGGIHPDNSTETAVLGYLESLASVETRLAELHESMIANQIETIKIDPARAMLALRAEGRRFVGYLSDTLRTRPLRDVFSTPQYGGTE
jgi:hypothetical protein